MVKVARKIINKTKSNHQKIIQTVIWDYSKKNPKPTVEFIKTAGLLKYLKYISSMFKKYVNDNFMLTIL